MADVTLTIGGDEKDAQKVLDKIQRQVAKLKEQVATMNTEAKKGGAEASSGMEKYALSLLKGVSIAGAMTAAQQGFAMAIQVANDKLAAQIELQNKQRGVTISTADAEAAAMRNFGQSTRAQRDEQRQVVENMSKETGFSKKEIWSQFSDAYSAKGNLSNKVVEDAVRQATRLVPEAGATAERKTTTAAAIDLAKVTGSEDARENLGFMMAVGSKARITSTKDLMENSVPAIGGIKAYGGTDVEAGALFSAFTQESTDTTGRISGNASISLADQLRTLLPKEKGLADRIAKVQGNKALQKRLFTEGSKDALTLEAKMKPYAEQLLTNPESNIAKEFQANLKALPSAGAGRAEIFEANVEGVSESSQAAVAIEDRKLAASAENAYDLPEEATKASMRDYVKNSLDQAGYSESGSWGAWFQGRGMLEHGFEKSVQNGYDPKESAEWTLQGAADNASGSDRDILLKQLEALKALGNKKSTVPKGGEQ